MNKYTKASFWLTSALAVFTVALFIWKKSELQQLKLNEFGDLAAGFAAALALIWLICGSLQQSDELRLNTQALRLQQDELKNQVAETKRLVESNNEQAQAHTQILRLEEDRRSSEKEAENRKMEPLFRYKSQGGSRSGNRQSGQGLLTNSGGNATNIELSGDDPDFPISIQHLDLINGDNHLLHWKIEGSPKPPSGGPVEFRYLDSAGLPNVQIYSFGSALARMDYDHEETVAAREREKVRELRDHFADAKYDVTKLRKFYRKNNYMPS